MAAVNLPEDEFTEYLQRNDQIEVISDTPLHPATGEKPKPKGKAKDEDEATVAEKASAAARAADAAVLQPLKQLAEANLNRANQARDWVASRPTPGSIGLLLLALILLVWVLIPVAEGKTRAQLLWLTLLGKTRLKGRRRIMEGYEGGTAEDEGEPWSGGGSGGSGGGGGGSGFGYSPRRRQVPIEVAGDPHEDDDDWRVTSGGDPNDPDDDGFQLDDLTDWEEFDEP